VFEFNICRRGEVYLIKLYEIKFVSKLYIVDKQTFVIKL